MVTEPLKRQAFNNILRKPCAKIFAPYSGRPLLNDIADGICPTCGKKVGEFRDKKSEQEYTISGMCQACQDEIFGK